MNKPVTARSIREWPRGFLDHLLGDPNAMTELPSDFDGSLAYSISTLDKRTGQMILERYRERMTLCEIAERHHVTTERARQIIAKGMRMLRHPYRLRFIQYGVSAVLIHEKGEAARKARARAETEAVRNYLLEQANDPEGSIRDAKKDLYSVSVRDIGLSNRACHCLCRSGCETIEDVLGKSADELMRTRNIGVKTHNEIVNKLESMGFNVQHLRRKDKM